MLAVLAVGCTEDLTPATRIARNRVLGVRTVIEDAPARAWPLPGERVTLRWLVVDEGEPRPLSWAFVACVAVPVGFGIPFCAGDPIAFLLPAAPAQGVAPEFGLTVPDAEALGDADKLLVLGVICADGTPVFDLETRTGECSGSGAQQTLVKATLQVQTDEATNSHPSFGDPEGLEIGDVPWLGYQGDAQSSECPEAPALAELDAGGGAAEIVVDPPNDARETVDGESEVLILSAFATSGDLERQFSVIDEHQPRVSLDWTPPAPADVPAAGLVVRFVFVLRDQRGGVAWAERYACVRLGDAT